MDIVCKRCRASIPAADVNLEHRMAKCRACNSVFDFSSQLGAAEPAPIGRRRAPVPMPVGLEIVEDGGGRREDGGYRDAPGGGGKLVIARRWFSARLFFMVFFCIAWDGFLVFWYTHVHGAGFIAVLFPIAHVAAGIGITYATIAGFVNRTWIVVDGGTLRIRHAPLPWLGNRILDASDLEQLYCKEVRSTSSNSGTSTSYTLAAVLKGGRQVQLLKSLPQADQALFIEQRVEDRLGIVDVPVGGEYAGAL
jgi:hypothetical protein